MAGRNPIQATGHGTAPRWFDRTAHAGARGMSGLAEVMTAVAKAWTREFSTLSSAPGEITFKSATTTTVADAVSGVNPFTTFGTLHAAPWNTALAMRFEQAFVAVTVEALFGGAGEEQPDRTPGPLSPIETRIADMIGNQVADAMTDGFADLLPATFSFAGLQAKLDPSLLGNGSATILVATFALTTLWGTVELDLLVPQAALDIIGPQLAISSDKPQAVPDRQWSDRLEAEVSRTSVTLTAVMASDPMSLGAIASLRIGQVLTLPIGADKAIRLTCEDRALFRCDLGQSTGVYTVRINAPMSPG